MNTLLSRNLNTAKKPVRSTCGRLGGNGNGNDNQLSGGSRKKVTEEKREREKKRNERQKKQRDNYSRQEQ